VEEPDNIKGPSLEYFSVLQEFEDVFQEIPGLPPRREIDFSIDLVARASLVSKTPYRVSTQELKELQMKLEEFLRNVTYIQGFHLGEHQYFLSKRRMEP
jgi:hypothetical protein